MRFICSFDAYSKILGRLLVQGSYCDRIIDSIDTIKELDDRDELIFTPIARPPEKLLQSLVNFSGKKTIWVDWTHLQFEDDLNSLKRISWDRVTSCVPIPLLPVEYRAKAIYTERSPVLLEESLKFKKILSVKDGNCGIFVSQPLIEDRGPPYNQVALFESLRAQSPVPGVESWTILKHPREDFRNWEDCPCEVVSGIEPLSQRSFALIAGYTSMLLLGALTAGFRVISIRFPGWTPNCFNIPDRIIDFTK